MAAADRRPVSAGGNGLLPISGAATMAKAEALELVGESQQATALIERHLKAGMTPATTDATG